MKHYRLISLILLLCLLIGAAAPAASADSVLEEPTVSARAAIVVDLGTGEVIWEKNADERLSPASLTKIMTCLLAVEAAEEGRADMSETVPAGQDCWFGIDTSGSNVGISVGEQMSYRDLFYCAMLPSANEACNVLASRLAGSIGGFIGDSAKSLGDSCGRLFK